MTTILRAEQISKSYQLGKRQIPVLRGVDLSLEQGEIAALVGASGAGKSTLLHVLGLLDPPSSGIVYYGDRTVSGLAPRQQAKLRHEFVGFVFQFYHLIAELTALQNVLLGAMMEGGIASYMGKRKRLRQRAIELLTEMGLSDRLKHHPSQLSGGERQRVAIARALIAEPRVILADEPTGNLDSETSAEILDLIWRINQERGISFLLVTHNESLAARCDHTLRLRDGQSLKAESA
ncbi:MAG: hypothetical protein CSA62_12905 [Planctomycetota bacterium]|nr:MAG: hypothetical protein CSA62_12905 [Planctomycetota bacterium]